jgi:hypothetical protein
MWLSGKHQEEGRRVSDQNDVDQLIAAIFAAQICANPATKREDYLKEYDAFLVLLQQRDDRHRYEKGQVVAAIAKNALASS